MTGPNICIITKDMDAVWHFDGDWNQIGGPAAEINSDGDWGLIQRGAPANDAFYLGGDGQWENMKGPRGRYSVGGDTVYAVPNTLFPEAPHGVYQFDGNAGNGEPIWSKIGGPSFNGGVLAGNWGVLAAPDGLGDLWRYTGTPNQWEVIAPNKGRDDVAIADTVYRKAYAPDWRIYRYNGNGTAWTPVTDQLVAHAVVMRAGNWGFVYTDYDVDSMFRFTGGQFVKIGPHRPYFAVADDTVYAIPINKSGVYRYDGGDDVDEYRWPSPK
ncbi:hypothetical protein [Streptomyces sp. NBC_00893]|uniref:hypothetical protein n=1 Tax=Streptomyces sp. NBC_00893 TaxID=2975862 RepID=UPI00225130CE|nr:hypothetical protein [Streptomyces sp. NBC_00893]MCX4851374.1 hypothetical protein [Streptomyces sp. NBC_00893]